MFEVGKCHDYSRWFMMIHDDHYDDHYAPDRGETTSCTVVHPLHRASTATGHLCTSASSSKQLCGYATTAIQQLANPLLAQLHTAPHRFSSSFSSRQNANLSDLILGPERNTWKGWPILNLPRCCMSGNANQSSEVWDFNLIQHVCWTFAEGSQCSPLIALQSFAQLPQADTESPAGHAW